MAQYRPSNAHFTKEKLIWSFRKVGFVPFQYAAQKEKCEKELGQDNKDKALEVLQFKYDMLVNTLEGIEHKPGIFEATVPMVVHVKRAETETAQIEQLLIRGTTFSGVRAVGPLCLPY